jgi:hypothetical protein
VRQPSLRGDGGEIGEQFITEPRGIINSAKINNPLVG